MNERIRGEIVTDIVGDITTGPFSTEYMNAILKKFGKVAFGRSSVCMEFESFLKQIKAAGNCCLEIGTFHGVSAVILSQFFEKVVSVTIEAPGQEILKHQITEYLGIKNIQFYDVKDNNEKKQVIDSLNFDFCYSDGDHTNDTMFDYELVKRCGRVLFHEYWPLQPAVWNLVNSLPKNKVKRASVDSFAYWDINGFSR